jgi:flavin-dependent dehydrogenase
VWRPRFDQILLDNARARGVDVREGHSATGALWHGEAARGVRYRTDAGAEGVVEAEFLLDASGQSGLVGRALGLRQWDTFFRNLAVYGYYQGAERLPDPDETNIFIESYQGGGGYGTFPLRTAWPASAP